MKEVLKKKTYNGRVQYDVVGHPWEENFECVTVEVPERNSTRDQISRQICHVRLQLSKRWREMWQ